MDESGEYQRLVARISEAGSADPSPALEALTRPPAVVLLRRAARTAAVSAGCPEPDDLACARILAHVARALIERDGLRPPPGYAGAPEAWLFRLLLHAARACRDQEGPAFQKG